MHGDAVTDPPRLPRAPLDPKTAPQTEDGPLVRCEGIIHVFAGDGRCQCGEMVHEFLPDHSTARGGNDGGERKDPGRDARLGPD